MLSDRVVDWLVVDHATEVWVHTVKGVAFVSLTAVLLYVLVFEYLRRNERVSQQLRDQQVQLAHANRVAVAGELSASLVHELAQPLDAITLYAETSLARVEQGDRLHEPLQAVVDQSHRGRRIIDRLRAFIRRHEGQKERFAIRDLIQETLTMLASDLRRLSVTVRFHAADNAGLVVADRVQIQQVLVNLILNAGEATTHRVGARLVDIYLAVEDDRCMVTVADNGPGVSEALASKLFEAFETSKEGGLGLGLAISRSIVHSHKGELWYEPRSSGGAAFIFSLPKGDRHATAS
jgi:two-component system sensor kinase FixL